MPALPTGTISISQINAEFGRGTSLSSYHGVTWYTDSGSSGTFPSGTISMSDFWGKRATAPAPSSSLTGSPSSGSYFDDLGYTFPYNTQLVLRFYRNGSWDAQGLNGFYDSGNWVSPASSTVGDSYWIRFTRTGTMGFGGTSTPSSGWLQLNGTQLISVQRSGNGLFAGIYNIDFSSNGGASTLQTLSNITIAAEGVA